MVEAELDAMIRRRDEKRRRDEGERPEEALWLESERKYAARRREGWWLSGAGGRGDSYCENAAQQRGVEIPVGA